MPKETSVKDSQISHIREIRDKVVTTIRRYGLVNSGHPVVVGCSGGADSTCLLHVLVFGLAELQLRCTAVYVDHGLRPDTENEQERVRRLARELGVGFRVAKVDVPTYVAQNGASVQDAARRLRYSALRDVAADVGADTIAVGHTQTDQAETVLLQLLRGAGSTGLAAMAPRSGQVVRPLLDMTREDTEAYCHHYKIGWFEDPSNKNRRYMRTRVRHDLIPYLQQLNPRIVSGLSRTADILRAEDDYMDKQARAELKNLTCSVPDTAGLALDVGRLRNLPLALLRRVLRLAVADVAPEGEGLTFEHVEDMIELIGRDRSGDRLDVFGRIWVIREYERLLVLLRDSWQKEKRNRGQTVLSLPIGEKTKLPWGQGWIQAQVEEVNPMGGEVSWAHQTSNMAVMDHDTVVGPLFVRTRRPGDRLRPFGLGGEKKVKDLMIDKKIPSRLRDTIPIVCDEKGIVWVAGLAMAERGKVTVNTKRVLHLEVMDE